MCDQKISDEWCRSNEFENWLEVVVENGGRKESSEIYFMSRFKNCCRYATLDNNA